MPKEKKGEDTKERGKRKRRLLRAGVHLVDSVAKVAICGTTKVATPHGPRDVALPCQSCGARDVTVQLL